MIERHITEALVAALQSAPVVLLHGARQTGKSTLVRWLVEHGHKATYFTLDDAALLSAATRDADAFLRATTGPIIIDEVQLAPDLFRAIKIEVDRRRTRGTVSAHRVGQCAPTAQTLGIARRPDANSDALAVLAGRIARSTRGLRRSAFRSRGSHAACRSWDVDRADLLARIVTGGYPEVSSELAFDQRATWFGSYITTILQRDVRQMADIAGLTEMPRLLALLAAQSGGLLNMAELSRDSAISQATIKPLPSPAAGYAPVPASHGLGGQRSQTAHQSAKGLPERYGLACLSPAASIKRTWEHRERTSEPC